jgi:small multidrug resistance pump
MPLLLLACAIVCEVTGTICLRLSDGFAKVGYSAVVVVCYVTAFVLFAQVLKRGMPVGVAYGIWAASGVALVAIIGTLLLSDHLTRTQVCGLVLVCLGVVALELGGAH